MKVLFLGFMMTISSLSYAYESLNKLVQVKASNIVSLTCLSVGSNLTLLSLDGNDVQAIGDKLVTIFRFTDYSPEGASSVLRYEVKVGDTTIASCDNYHIRLFKY